MMVIMYGGWLILWFMRLAAPKLIVATIKFRRKADLASSGKAGWHRDRGSEPETGIFTAKQPFLLPVHY